MYIGDRFAKARLHQQDQLRGIYYLRGMTKRLFSLMVGLSLISLLGVACGNGQTGDPKEPVRAFFVEFAKARPNYDSMLCADSNVRRGVENGAVFTHLALLVMAESGPATLGYQDLQVEDKSNDGKAAVVHVTGTFSVSLPSGPVALPPDLSHIDTEVTVVRENNQWKMCSNPF